MNPTPKQKLVLDYLDAMDLDSMAMTMSKVILQEGGPFNDVETHYRDFTRQALHHLKQERMSLAILFEDLYSEEELRFLIDLTKNPLWIQVQEKIPAMTLQMGDVMRRAMEAADRDLRKPS